MCENPNLFKFVVSIGCQLDDQHCGCPHLIGRHQQTFPAEMQTVAAAVEISTLMMSAECLTRMNC